MSLPQRTDLLSQSSKDNRKPTTPEFTHISETIPGVIDFIIQQAAQKQTDRPSTSGDRIYRCAA